MARSRLQRLAALLRATPLHPQWLLGRGNAFRERLGTLPPGRVLDIGCADRWVERALPAGCEYIGLDYPATGAAMYGSRPDVFGDAARLPLPDASVDAVVMLEVLEHLREPQAALAEAARVLRPGGRLLLSMPFLYPIHDAPHDYQRLTVHGLTRDLHLAGFDGLEVDRRLSALETSAVLAAIVLAASAIGSVRARSLSLFIAPLLLASVPVVNVAGWLAGRFLPDWAAMTNGYIVHAKAAGKTRVEEGAVR